MRDDYKSAIRLRKLGLLPEEEEKNETTPHVEKAADVKVAEEKPTATPTMPSDLITTVGQLLTKYTETGFLTEDCEKRQGEAAETENRNCKKLMPFWEKIAIADVRRSKMVAYKARRGGSKIRRVDTRD